MKTMTGIRRAPRRQHERAFKAELVEQCLVPGASVAAVALAGGINANMLFKWRRDHLRSMQPNSAASSASASAVLVPVHVAPSLDAGAGSSQPIPPLPTSTLMAVTTQRLARSAGTIEIDIAGAVLRLCGPVDEFSLFCVLRALRQST